jgi:hypothetical protein
LENVFVLLHTEKRALNQKEKNVDTVSSTKAVFCCWQLEHGNFRDELPTPTGN